MNTSKINVGDIVKLSKPREDERAFRFVVTMDAHPETGLVTIKWINSGMNIAPISQVHSSEVEIAGKLPFAYRVDSRGIGGRTAQAFCHTREQAEKIAKEHAEQLHGCTSAIDQIL